MLRLHAAGCSVRPRPTLSLPGGKAPSATLYRLLLFHLRPRPTFSLPGARHSLPRSAVHYCFACLRALLCPFPVAMQSLPRPAAYYHLTASALNVAPSRRHCTLCRGQPVIESFQYIFGVDAGIIDKYRLGHQSGLYEGSPQGPAAIFNGFVCDGHLVFS